MIKANYLDLFIVKSFYFLPFISRSHWYRNLDSLILSTEMVGCLFKNTEGIINESITKWDVKS